MNALHSTLIVRVRVEPFWILTVSDKPYLVAQSRWKYRTLLYRNVIIAQKEATKLSASPSSMIRGYLMSSVNSFPRTHILGRELTDFRIPLAVAPRETHVGSCTHRIILALLISRTANYEIIERCVSTQLRSVRMCIYIYIYIYICFLPFMYTYMYIY